MIDPVAATKMQAVLVSSRHGVHRPGHELINVWISEELLDKLDKSVSRQDTDRSKFIRAAIREKMQREEAA